MILRRSVSLIVCILMLAGTSLLHAQQDEAKHRKMQYEMIVEGRASMGVTNDFRDYISTELARYQELYTQEKKAGGSQRKVERLSQVVNWFEKQERVMSAMSDAKRELATLRLKKDEESKSRKKDLQKEVISLARSLQALRENPPRT